MELESRKKSTVETSVCEFRCPVIDQDKNAVQFGHSDSEAETDLKRHINESIVNGCVGPETDTHANRIVCPLYGVSVDLNT